MTVSSLSKIILGVKNIVVEKVEIEECNQDSQLIISARPHKRDMCRCSVCGQKSPRYDRGNGIRRWRAPDFGSGMKVYVEAEAPRVCCPEHGVVVQQFPWARHHSKFTRNFEDTAVWLSLHLSRKAVAEYLRISWDTVGPIISRVEKELSANHQPLDNLVNIGIDETSYKKGHKYITVIVNHDTNTVVWAAKGHGKSVLEPFFKQLDVKQRSKIRLVSGDGARWIKDTVEEYCANAEFCIDPFHVVAWCTKVLDEVRREEWNKARAELAKEKKEKSGRGRPKGGRKQKSAAEQHVDAVKSSRYSLLMNPENLSETYQAKLKQLLLHDKRLATAYRLKEELRLIFKLSPDEVSAALDKWRRRAWSCRIEQFVELQRKIKRHKDAIIATITNGISNARIEATNNKIKLSVRMAYGFRNIDNLISMIMLRCGGLNIGLPGRAQKI